MTEWTKEKVISELQEEAEEGIAPSSNERGDLYYWAKKLFGSWSEACNAASLRTRTGTNWTKERVVEKIKELAENNVAPSSEEHPNLYHASRRVFESWEEAVNEAGLETQKDKRTSSKERVIKEIQQRAEDGVAPRSDEHAKLTSRAEKFFGTWTNACKQAGIKTARRATFPDTETMLEKLREASSDGVAPPTKEFKHYQALTNRFDSWEQACAQAGVEPKGKKKWTKERILKQLKEDAEDGIAPSSGDVKYRSSACREFGSWRSACEAAGVVARNEQRGVDDEKLRTWTKKKLIQQIREDSTDGIAPAKPYYLDIAVGRFGSWEEACEAAGVKSKSHLVRRTKEELIERIRDQAEDGVAPPTTACQSLYATVRNRFDSWKQACHKAGVETHTEAKQLSEEELLERIREVSEDGIAPEHTKHRRLRRQAIHIFGDWVTACQKAGVKARSQLPMKWNAEIVVETIQEHAENGIAPPTENVHTLASAARRYFDSWAEACREAGVKSRGELQIVAPEEILNKIRAHSKEGVAPPSQEVHQLSMQAQRKFGSWKKACEAAGVKPRSEA